MLSAKEQTYKSTYTPYPDPRTQEFQTETSLKKIDFCGGKLRFEWLVNNSSDSNFSTMRKPEYLFLKLGQTWVSHLFILIAWVTGRERNRDRLRMNFQTCQQKI